jgi:thiol-disulfide isomerase/thioredoxin
MMRLLFLTLAICFSQAALTAQKPGHQIKVKIEGYDQQQLFLGYYYGDKQYLRDTAFAEPNGWFYFEGEEKLEGGIYLVILPPDNQFFQFVVDADNQWISLETKMPLAEMVNNMKIKDAGDNQLFYDYLKYLEGKRPEAEALKKDLEAAADNEDKKQKIQEKLTKIDAAVEDYQRKVIQNHPKTVTAAVIRSNMQLPEIPQFEGEQKERELKAFYWMRAHWFDNIDLADSRMLRTPFMFQKVDHYVNKMTVQVPDSIDAAIDFILEKVRPSQESFKFYLVHFLNTYAKSNIVGMDAVYVHVAKKYFETGQATWTEAENLKKIVENANKLEPLLIGKIAPNIEMQAESGASMKLHDFKSPYTVLFFWDPDCGHCKKSMPDMVKFAKDFKDRGVGVFAVCTKLATRDDSGNISLKEIDSCWSTVKEKEMDVFFNAVDPYHRSRYKTVYDIRSTPQIFVLNDKKEIISKRIGAEQLPDVMEQILKIDKGE